ncbi:flagellar biosynthesis anti-sigma factor FlgM [Microaerobacter geothermalis]|uniref:flagellar biosynthesis anti-sigma factor FlgM n=1 Tax=Microaerobacter geothermalis TaxID=674972 RepID=UPI001F2BC58E|nr:flagellar biosynthesis anti-sigma factor FlgM [Microaerobacter geothermalis]MCF6093412.1 flagellar biosynthesis anti-sigma factor FlgM [Microaerobacter geothermalis]
MRINEPNRIGALNAYQKTQGVQKKGKNELMKRDQVEISTEAKAMLEQAAPLSGPERQQKINQLKEQVQSGQYQVNSEKVADKVLRFWKGI